MDSKLFIAISSSTETFRALIYEVLVDCTLEILHIHLYLYTNTHNLYKVHIRNIFVFIQQKPHHN